MNKEIKIIPLYLPQFHTIPENDEWWGKGFTEWVNVKGAKPLFEGHNQPRVPLNDNYYDLSDIETLKWQCKIAKEHGIYGFCMYHYWFKGKLLLEKPMEMLLAHPEIDIKYCISWANGEWRDSWKAKNKADSKVLIFDDFDDEQGWIDHFNYMLPFFKDSRYMCENNKPLLVIYTPYVILKLNKMLDLWTKMANEAGFDGITYIYQSAASYFNTAWDSSKFQYGIEMNPGYINGHGNKHSKLHSLLMKYSVNIKRALNIKRSLMLKRTKNELQIFDYDSAWQKLLSLKPTPRGNETMIPCAFTDWDNTPRYGKEGWVYSGVSPEKFKKYFAQLIENTRKYYNTDMIFVFAWNEWAEGGYLEPDTKNGWGNLEAIRDVLKEMDNAK
ncbi:MAG: glycoside hydrolase family 99-like domain-containing protein [Bacteroidaceae bacterium]|nr:glycoside hydrolase family 99-like domain-containing protein [Bacteroidaceae bacterium]